MLGPTLGVKSDKISSLLARQYRASLKDIKEVP